jgi:hypothetical protein
MVDFDDLFNFPAAPLGSEPKAEIKFGLVVAQKAKTGDELVAEAARFQREIEQAGPFVIFTEIDEDGGEEKISNAKEWADHLGIDHAPTEQEILHWRKR